MSPPIYFLPGEEEQELEYYRRMPMENKWRVIEMLNGLQSERERADIRARYGEVSDEEMRMRIVLKRYGYEMMVKMFGTPAVVRVVGPDAAGPAG